MQSILDLIPFGKKHAITREQLELKAGLSDRTNRGLIKKECIQKDEAVISLPKGKGYYRAVPKVDTDAVIHQMRQNAKVAMSNLENNKPLKKWLEKNSGQQEMDFSA